MVQGIREYFHIVWDSVFKLGNVVGDSMKPTRIRMCHSLVMNYGLYKKMEIYVRYLRTRVPTTFCGADTSSSTCNSVQSLPPNGR